VMRFGPPGLSSNTLALGGASPCYRNP